MTTHEHDQKLPIAIPLDQLRSMAVAVAQQLQGGAAITPELREQFINVRAALFQRGIYDPVLVRFDTASAPPASPQEIGAQLAAVAETL